MKQFVVKNADLKLFDGIGENVFCHEGSRVLIFGPLDVSEIGEVEKGPRFAVATYGTGHGTVRKS